MSNSVVNMPTVQNFEGEIFMSNEEKKIGRIERFYNRIRNKETTGDYIIYGIAFVFTIVLCSMIIAASGGIQGIRTFYVYPEAEYQYLSAEIKKVIANNVIDTNQILDQEIESSVTYNKKAGEKEWSSAEVKLTKQNATVSATITQDDYRALNMDEPTYNNKVDHYGGAIFGTLFIVGACFAVSIILGKICYYVFLVVIWILKSIEKTIKRRKKI